MRAASTQKYCCMYIIQLGTRNIQQTTMILFRNIALLRGAVATSLVNNTMTNTKIVQ